MKNKFAENMKLYRKAQHLTQADVAQRLGTTQRAVSYWETGVNQPDYDTLLAISELFDISTDDLLGR